jgi:hypothetical protein
MREWFYAGFAGRIYMVMICDERASAESGRRRGWWRFSEETGVEEETVAAIGAARFVYRG